MSPVYPSDLDGKTAEEVALEYLGEELSPDGWWTLKRSSTASFEWGDLRLALSWRATHGYLVALHEIATPEHAGDFAKRNNIKLFDDGGLYFRGVAEIYIRCEGLPAPELVRTVDDLYRIRTSGGIDASVGYASSLFRRLVGRPNAEVNPRLPDPTTLTTLVISNVVPDNIPGTAELMLYYLRKSFAGVRFGFWRLPDLHLAPQFDEPVNPPSPVGLIESVATANRPEAIAFYNRAQEVDPIAGFLYFYRVLESCFDDVLRGEITTWRGDTALDSIDLLQRIRSLQFQKEDKWALRRVLGKLLTQPIIDRAHSDGLIPEPSADALSTHVYLRRNSIAHGRRGQHERVLVPFGFSSGGIGHHDRLWYNLMERLATLALETWIFV